MSNSISTDYSQLFVNGNNGNGNSAAKTNNANANVNANPNSTAGQAAVAAALFDNSTSTDDTTNVNANTAAVYESMATSTNAATYKPDPAKVQQMLDEMNNNTNSLKELVRKMLEKQASKNAIANGTASDDEMDKLMKAITGNNGKHVGQPAADVTVDDATRAAAQQDISEDGYYGVKAVTQRLMDFAGALSGGDPSKAETLRQAVQAGFKQAEDQWGGKLPQISQDTYDSVMKAFDTWEQTGTIPTSTDQLATSSATLGLLNGDSSNAADATGTVNPAAKTNNGNGNNK